MSIATTRDWSEKTSGNWRMLGLTGLAVVLSLMTWFSATAVLPELTSDLGLSASEAAWLTNMVQLGFVLGALVSSLLSLGDIWPLTRLMAGAAVLSGLANLLLLGDLGSSGAIAARFITGIALAGVYPPAMKFIATWFKTGRGLAMGVMVGALTLGSAMPHLFRASSDVHWELVVLICSLGSFAAAAIFGGMLHEGPHRFRRTSVDLRQIGAILRNGPVILANIGYFGHMWELYAMWAWFLAFATSAEQTGTGVANASLLTFAVIAIGLPGCAFGGWLADRIGRCLTTMLMMGLSGFSAFLIGFAYDSTAWAFVLVALVWGFTVIADSAQFSAAITELSEPHLVGSSLAFQMGVGFALTIIVIWLIPLLAEALGSWRWTFLLLVPGPLIGVLAMGALWKHPRAFRMAGGNR